MWYSWSSLEDFRAWHSDTCLLLGLPRPGRNAQTGEIDANAQWTTNYTEPVFIATNDIRAFVEQSVAELLPNLLGKSSEKPEASSDIIFEVPS